MVTVDSLPKSYKSAIKNIKSKGFTHFKIELEANLERGENVEYCSDCNDGWNTCEDCGGDGYLLLTTDAGGDYEEECANCRGEGMFECSSCYGRGSHTTDFDTADCQDRLISYISQEARDALDFYKFYDDGSVDSELTATLPIEKAHLGIELIRAFSRLAEDIGNGMNTDNAGMHLSLLPSSVYPCRDVRLNQRYMNNFKTQVTKLLPALFFTASHNSETRSLEYRYPRVSEDEKYSAIYTHGDSCLEYRLFDTCYDEPEALYDKIEVMAKTLRYYSNEKVAVKFKTFEFVNTREIKSLFDHPERYDALNETLPLVKPSKSAKKLKQDRAITYNKRDLTAKIRQLLSNQKVRYSQYLEHHKAQYERYLDRFIMQQTDALQEFRQYGIQSMSRPFLHDEVITNPNILGNREQMIALFRRTTDYNYTEPLPIDEWAKQELSSHYNTYYTLRLDNQPN